MPEPAQTDQDVAGPGAPSSRASAAIFSPIESPTAFEQTVERLGSAIRLGIPAPDSRLPSERDMAQAFQISRTTLRQAIVALVQARLLTTRRGRRGGTWVASDLPAQSTAPASGENDWEETLDMRLAVELASAMLAAEHAQTPVLTELLGLCDELDGLVAAGEEYLSYRQVDVKFHILLAEASGSTVLVAQMTAAQDAMSALTGTRPWPTIVLQRANRQHREVVRAISDRNISSTATIMFEHIEGSRLIVRGMGTD
ncbi:MAG: FadR/GntR family transcriptional regulator [Thermomicrobiales bacterium]